MGYQNIIFQVEGPVAIVKINRPKALNALNPDVVAELNQVLDLLEKDDAVKVLVVTGEGTRPLWPVRISVTCPNSPLWRPEVVSPGPRTGAAHREPSIPVIACVNGFALGEGPSWP